MKALDVYKGSDAAVTKAYYADLAAVGLVGTVAVNLFRALKASTRAKVYRGGIAGRGSFRSMAYDHKGWSMKNLCNTLCDHADDLGIRFGWQKDPSTLLRGQVSWVLYVDIPTGQVSFHSPVRYGGPDYEGKWDGVRTASCTRILAFCDQVLEKGKFSHVPCSAPVSIESAKKRQASLFSEEDSAGSQSPG
jgi:hypothetical protein